MEEAGAGRGPAFLTFQFEVGGRVRDVAVRRAEQGFEVTLDGRRLVADLVRTGSGWSLLVGPPDRGPLQSFELAIDEHPDGATVYVEGQPIPVRTAGVAGRFGRRGSSSEQGASGPRRIIAPMPGRVVKVLVKPGDTVDARQGLVVVEAMKMENELRAPGAGTVTEVKVAEGASVEANTVLVVIS
jgi:biotin carboxyl carrier protein